MSTKIMCMQFDHAGHDIELVLEEVAAASDGWVFRMYVDGSNDGYFDKDLNQNEDPRDYFNFWMPYVNQQLEQLAGEPVPVPDWVESYKNELMGNWVYNNGQIVVDV